MKVTSIKYVGSGGNDSLYYLIKTAIDSSRFTAQFESIAKGLKITNVRLRDRKLCCGNHPNSCEIGGEETSKRGRYLEGADWVEFNDMLNDTLDKYNISARIESAACIVRKGNLRRTHYGSHRPQFGRNFQWNRDESPIHWTDNTTMIVGAMHSTFPEGTPGRYDAIGYNEVG